MNDPLRKHFLSMMLPKQRQKNGAPFGPKALICRCGVRVAQDEDGEQTTKCSGCGLVWRWDADAGR